MMFWGREGGRARSHFLECFTSGTISQGTFLAEAKASISGRKCPLFTKEIWLTLRIKGEI